MLVVVNTCFPEAAASVPIYYQQLIKQLVTSSPEHRFRSYVNAGTGISSNMEAPLETVFVSPLKSHNPLQKLLWRRKLTRQLLAEKPSVIINCNPFTNIATGTKQLLLLDESAVELFAHGLKFTARKALLRNLTMAQKVLVSSGFDKERLLSRLRDQPANIEILGSGPQLHSLQLDWDRKQAVKEQFTEGKEFFLLAPVRLKADQLIQLLKAFSMFKKRQHSNLQLLLPAKTTENLPDFTSKLASYKYRNDVVLLPKLADHDMLELLASAYAIIDPADHMFSSALALQAFESGTPIIIDSNGRSKELAGENSILEASLANPELLANQMMLLYKDEHLRKRMILEGHTILERNNWQTAAQKLKNCLQTIIQA